MSEEDQSSEVILSPDSEDEQAECELSGDEDDSDTDYESPTEDENLTDATNQVEVSVNRSTNWKLNCGATFQPDIVPCTSTTTEITGLGLNSSMTPLDILECLITPSIVTDVVHETNLFADDIRIAKPTSMPRWKPVSQKELWRFFAIDLLMGLVEKPTIKDYWSTRELIRAPMFGTIMSRNRFEEILRCLHFNKNQNNTQVNPNRFAKLGNFFTELLHNFRSCCTPGEYISIDESLVPFKGRASFRQFIPSKRARFGIKFFMLVVCLTKIILNMIPYLGKKTPWDPSYPRELHGVGGIAVLTLMQDHFGRHRKLVVDNWFTSVSLAKELLSKQTYLLGTVRKTRKNMPKMLPRKLPKGEVQTYSTKDCLVERWSERREVCMLNTFMDHEMVNAVTPNPNNARQKPATVLKYNKTMGAVDDVDRQLAPYENNRKTIKWYKKVAFRMLKWAVYQAYRIYLVLHPSTTLRYKEFIMNVVEEILKKYPKEDVTQPLAHCYPKTVGEHFPEKVISSSGAPSKSDCYYCKSVLKKRTQTPFKCSCCLKRFCIQGRNSCFKIFHQSNQS